MTKQRSGVRRRHRSHRLVAWAAAAIVGVTALAVAAFAEAPPRTNADRAHALAERLACPVCQGQSVAESDVVVARNIRREIRIWVDEGRSDDYIRAQLTAIYGDDIDYTPSASGISSVVWILPVVVGVTAVAGLTSVFAGRSPPSTTQVVASSGALAGAGASDPTPRLRQDTPAADGDVTTNPWRRRLSWTMAVAVAVLLGVLVARSAGTRGEGDTITGDVRASARELLVDAQQSFARGDMDAAVGIYDEVLELAPSNVEALAYKAWLLRLSGDSSAAVTLITDAVEIDPDYVDARVFAAAIALDLGDNAAAVAHLDAFDRLDPPTLMRRLVSQQGLRDAVNEVKRADALGRVQAVMAAQSPVSFAESGITPEDLLLAAEALAVSDRLFEGLELVQRALVEQPDDVTLNVGYGWLLGRSVSDATPEPATVALTFLDRALESDPDHPEGLVYRAFVRSSLDDFQGARADLAAFDALAVQPHRLVDLIGSFELRAKLEGR